MSAIENSNQHGLKRIPSSSLTSLKMELLIFCKACTYLPVSREVNKQKLGILNSPFCFWTSKSSVFERHNVTKYHQDAKAKLEIYKSYRE